MLVADIAANWIELRDFCARSPLALSVLTLSGHRTLLPREDLARQPIHRVQRSIGSRYLLKTDIARFYSSIHTHNIPWAPAFPVGQRALGSKDTPLQGHPATLTPSKSLLATA
jgi:hypothetical protein